MSNPFTLLASNETPVDKHLSSKFNSNQALNGLRLAVKDLFHVRGLPTSAGNPDWLRTHKVPDDTNSTVKALLNAGAMFVGKTITDELAYSLHGQNKHYDALLNPAAPEHIPGGSSSGSAVAVTANLADIGLGTDTGGSIRVPASYQGLWGLRTSHGAVHCDNMVSLAPSFDTVGWMTRDIDTMIAVSDIVLAATVNNNEEHAAQSTLENTTFGIASQLFCNVAHSEQCQAWLSKLRATFQCNDIANNQLCVEAIDNASVFRTLQGSEIWQTHGAWIEETSPDIANDIMLRLNWCKSIPQQDVIDAKTKQQQITQHINALFNSNDVLVIPTTPGIAPRIDASETTLANDRNSLLTLTSLAGLTGLPQLHLPLFTLHNAPCGLSLVGRKGSDLALLSIAKALVTTLNE